MRASRAYPVGPSASSSEVLAVRVGGVAVGDPAGGDLGQRLVLVPDDLPVAG